MKRRPLGFGPRSNQSRSAANVSCLCYFVCTHDNAENSAFLNTSSSFSPYAQQEEREAVESNAETVIGIFYLRGSSHDGAYKIDEPGGCRQKSNYGNAQLPRLTDKTNFNNLTIYFLTKEQSMGHFLIPMENKRRLGSPDNIGPKKRRESQCYTHTGNAQQTFQVLAVRKRRKRLVDQAMVQKKGHCELLLTIIYTKAPLCADGVLRGIIALR